jgi:hypothetical protein
MSIAVNACRGPAIIAGTSMRAEGEMARDGVGFGDVQSMFCRRRVGSFGSNLPVAAYLGERSESAHFGRRCPSR